jgi:hypothetical protein
MEGKSMKRLLSFVAQFLLMLVVFFAGSIAPVFHILPMWEVSAGATHWFVLDGVVVLLVLYVLLLLIALARRRLVRSGITSTAALLCAFVVGLLSKFPLLSK